MPKPEPLSHGDLNRKSDEVLEEEAKARLSGSASLQFATELLLDLRKRSFAWWTPDSLRARYSAESRMKWLVERADIRQEITTKVTGLLPKAARKKAPEFQASLIDAAIDDGDVTVGAFEDAFSPRDMVLYGPVADFWAFFRKSVPWNQDTPAHQEWMAFVLRELLTDRGSLGLPRRPILTAWELRTNIDGTVWHTRMPLEVRVAIDDARFARERTSPSHPFLAADDLNIALPDIIARHIPMVTCSKIIDAAGRAMQFEMPTEGAARGESSGRISVPPPPPVARASTPPRPRDSSFSIPRPSRPAVPEPTEVSSWGGGGDSPEGTEPMEQTSETPAVGSRKQPLAIAHLKELGVVVGGPAGEEAGTEAVSAGDGEATPLSQEDTSHGEVTINLDRQPN